jgi:hypothetical protein
MGRWIRSTPDRSLPHLQCSERQANPLGTLEGFTPLPCAQIAGKFFYLDSSGSDRYYPPLFFAKCTIRLQVSERFALEYANGNAVKIRDGRAAVSVCSEDHSEIPEAMGRL